MKSPYSTSHALLRKAARFGAALIALITASTFAQGGAEAREEAKDGNERKRFAPPVQSVIVYPDRVLVSREAKIMLEEGRQILVFADASSALDPSSLRGFSDDDGVVVQSVSTYVERQKEIRSDELRALDERKKALEQERSREEAAVERARLDQQGLDRYRQYLTDTISKESVEKTGSPTGWSDAMDFVAKRALEAKNQELKGVERIERIAEELSILQKDIDRLRSEGQRSKRTVEITVQVAKQGIASVGFSYHIRGASWSVSYGIHHQEDGGALVEYYGNVKQQTGEDWTNVQVRLSTSRPSYGAQRPGLRSLSVSAREAKVREQIQQAEAEVERPDVEESGPGSDGDTGGYASVEENTGSPVFLIPGRADIPSAERAFRLTIARFTLKPVQESYRIVGAQQRSAHLAVTLKNDRPFPLLAGPVDSYRNSGFTGRGEIGYTPSGANLVVGFGVDRNVRLRREVQTYRESGLFSGKVFRTIIDLEVGNEGGEARSIQVFERIPVSELESVKVRILPETTPGYTEEVEKSGILRWNISLASGEKRKIRLAFEVETPSDFKGEIYGR